MDETEAALYKGVLDFCMVQSVMIAHLGSAIQTLAERTGQDDIAKHMSEVAKYGSEEMDRLTEDLIHG